MPLPVSPVLNNPGTTLGQQRLNVFQAAANAWGAILNSNVEILVGAEMTQLFCSATSALLVVIREIPGDGEVQRPRCPGRQPEGGKQAADEPLVERLDRFFLLGERPRLLEEPGRALRIREGRRTAVWRSFFFRIQADSLDVDISGEPDVLGHRFVPRAEMPALLDAPYHRGFLEWLRSGGQVRYAFDRWED